MFFSFFKNESLKNFYNFLIGCSGWIIFKSFKLSFYFNNVNFGLFIALVSSGEGHHHRQRSVESEEHSDSHSEEQYNQRHRLDESEDHSNLHSDSQSVEHSQRHRINRNVERYTPPPCDQTNCSNSCSSKGLNGGTCNSNNINCDCTPYTPDTCNELCNLNGKPGIFCSGNSCTCGLCDQQICNTTCFAQNLVTEGQSYFPTCMGIANPTCFCNLDKILYNTTCEDSACSPYWNAYGLSRNCTGISIDLCQLGRQYCIPEICNQSCHESNSGNGTCMFECVCSAMPSNSTCVAEMEPRQKLPYDFYIFFLIQFEKLATAIVNFCGKISCYGNKWSNP